MQRVEQRASSGCGLLQKMKLLTHTPQAFQANLA
jgi:hypothetical protein